MRKLNEEADKKRRITQSVVGERVTRQTSAPGFKKPSSPRGGEDVF